MRAHGAPPRAVASLGRRLGGGLVGGAVGGWLAGAVLARTVGHAFDSAAALVVWAGRVASWYALVGLAIAATAIAVSAVLAWGRPRPPGILASARALGVLALGASLLLSLGCVLNFGVLRRPLRPDLLHVVANGGLVLLVSAAAVLLARAVGEGASRRDAWWVAAPALALAAWLAPAPRTAPLLPPPPAPDAAPCAVQPALAAAGRERAAPNVILISIDTLRADHMSLYGYPRATTPFLASLAAESVVFEQAIATKPSTSSSVATILTSRFPWAHGVHATSQVLPADNLTVAEALQAAGYETAAVVDNGNLFPLYGFDQGFARYDYGSYPAEALADRAIAWLSQSPRAPFFLWLHFLDPHHPYAPPPSYVLRFVGDAHYDQQPVPRPLPPTFLHVSAGVPPYEQDPERTMAWYVAQYDAEIRYTDDQIARVVAALRASGAADDTWLVITADHGECFGEQGEFGHGNVAHDAGLRVPLLLRPPGGTTGRRVDDVVSLVDVPATVLDAAGVPAPACFQGRSLVAAATRGPSDQRPAPVLAEAGFSAHVGAGNQLILRDAHDKLVVRDLAWVGDLRSPLAVVWLWNSWCEGGLADDELYDLGADPSETHDGAKAHPDVAQRMKAGLRDGLAATGPLHATARSVSPAELETAAPAVLEKLRLLGYVE